MLQISMNALKARMAVLRTVTITWEAIAAPVLLATNWQVMVVGAMVSTKNYHKCKLIELYIYWL